LIGDSEDTFKGFVEVRGGSNSLFRMKSTLLTARKDDISAQKINIPGKMMAANERSAMMTKENVWVENVAVDSTPPCPSLLNNVRPGKETLKA